MSRAVSFQTRLHPKAGAVSRLTAALIPLLILGIVVGSRRFIRTEPTTFRRFTLIVLIVLSIAGLVRAYYL